MKAGTDAPLTVDQIVERVLKGLVVGQEWDLADAAGALSEPWPTPDPSAARQLRVFAVTVAGRRGDEPALRAALASSEVAVVSAALDAISYYALAGFDGALSEVEARQALPVWVREYAADLGTDTDG